MKGLDTKSVADALTRIVEFELAGVVRFTHYSLMVTGPMRLSVVGFLKGQASESLLHAQKAGEILTGLGGHPSLKIESLDETHRHALADILAESLAHEQKAVELYQKLLALVREQSVYLEEYARQMISAEEAGVLELNKLLRDLAPQ